MNKNKPKLLIYIVAYNHEKFIINVFKRIPESLAKNYDVEILINDDSSEDKTFEVTQKFLKETSNIFKFKILYNPENQGYGGNQKIGYHYAIKNNFDFVALLHGDGQYAPEYLEKLVKNLEENNSDAVFGSRMILKGSARKGGMPLYKYIGNKILTNFQNLLLSTNLSEFHSGYRIYRINALKKIPFYLNSNGYSFDTEIIIQLTLAKLKMTEVAIPTYYGNEISYVNGFHYAYRISIATIHARLQNLGIFYDRKFDCNPNSEAIYFLKGNYVSTHSEILKLIKENSNVLDLGCNDGSVGMMIKNKKKCNVTGVDKKNYSQCSKLDNFILHNLNNGPPNIDYSKFDYIIMLDVIEHLSDPENFIDKLKILLSKNERVELFASTPNVAFFLLRLSLFFGFFNYGKRGILDRTHTRLFTFSTFSNFFEQSGYKVLMKKGIPVPYTLAIGLNLFSTLLQSLNIFLIKINKSLFSFQMLFHIKARISLESLLDKAEAESKKKNKQIVESKKI